MMNGKGRLTLGIVLSLLAVIVMSITEKLITSGYWTKSIIKIAVFASAVILYSFLTKRKINDVINIKKRLPSRKLLLMMVTVYLIIIVAYLLFKDQVDLTNIRNNLINKEHLTRDNFYWIFLYIIIINSFLEESFFRGFVFHAFKDVHKPLLGFVYGSLLFAVYHVGIISSWFNIFVFIISMIGLTGAGIVLQYIEERYNNILASYLVHGFANIAINTIGTFMILAS